MLVKQGHWSANPPFCNQFEEKQLFTSLQTLTMIKWTAKNFKAQWTLESVKWRCQQEKPTFLVANRFFCSLVNVYFLPHFTIMLYKSSLDNIITPKLLHINGFKIISQNLQIIHGVVRDFIIMLFNLKGYYVFTYRRVLVYSL